MNIIFLDIDGVLNCQIFYEERIKHSRDEWKSYPLCEICPKRIEWLNDLVEKTKAKIVISSTWRHSGIEYCKNVLEKCGFKGEIIDITPNIPRAVRGDEILEWINKNTEFLGVVCASDFETYVIIDDDSDMLLWQKDHFFQTDNYSGLTPNTCYKIKRFFERVKNVSKLS